MWESLAEAESYVREGQTIEWCDSCEGWTIVWENGYPDCYCN